ncbi:hypothetical protein FIBSPDRAFT_210440 [Athelia psychrophila]|uniref:Uncharacterized protein n=1 Tax=Athelia psychrophila TaxID=1759441 RepID=A0A166WRQ1_9AGAM|nr:hypothetical protein FIBSPDRAFT_210440 [Fibularhizoctonia sp. CBS 109695]
MFHLSPLPVNIPSLPAMTNFNALEDDEEDEDFKSIDKSPIDPKSTPYEPFSSIDPFPVASKTHVPRVSSGLAMTAPKTIDAWECATPASTKGYSPPASCSASPTKEVSRRERSMSHASDTVKPRDSSLGHNPSREESRSRDPVDYHRRRVQLHDLLESPGTSTSSSLPTHSYLQAIMTSESGPPRSLSSQSQGSAFGSRISPPPSTRPPLISHASSAAILLERERLEREKERAREQKEREVKDRYIERRHTVSASSRDWASQGSFGSLGRAAGKNANKIYSP